MKELLGRRMSFFSPNDTGELTENGARNEGNEAAGREEAESGMPLRCVSVSLLSID